MKDKDKIFIVCYINVGDIDEADVYQYLENAAQSLTFDETVFRLLIPTRDIPTKIECINPVLCNEEQYEKVNELIKNMELGIKDFELMTKKFKEKSPKK